MSIACGCCEKWIDPGAAVAICPGCAKEREQWLAEIEAFRNVLADAHARNGDLAAALERVNYIANQLLTAIQCERCQHVTPYLHGFRPRWYVRPIIRPKAPA